MIYLNPSEENHHSDDIIEDCLTVAEKLKVRILIRFREENVYHLRHTHGAVSVEAHAHHRHDDDDDIQAIPGALEVCKPMPLDLQDLLHNVIQDEEGKDTLAGHDEVVKCSDVAEKSHCAECP